MANYRATIKKKDQKINTSPVRYGKRVLAKDAIISNDTRATGLNCNDCIVGGSGAGKTGSVIIPSIQCIQTSLVVSDTKGQLAKRFGDELTAKGYSVHVLDFVNPEESCGYNPLQVIRKTEDGTYNDQDIASLAKSLVEPVKDQKEPIWSNSAASMLAFIIGYCVEKEPVHKHNMGEVCSLYNIFISPCGANYFKDWVDRHPGSFAAKKYNEIAAIRPAEKMFSSIVGFANEALAPYVSKVNKSIYARADKKYFDIASLGKQKCALFINVSDTDPNCDAQVNLFYSQALRILCREADKNSDGRLRIPCRIFMDDFAASARIDNFSKIMSVIRSRDIFVTLVLQSLSQLISMYGECDALTIINNCDHLLYLSSQDSKTAEFVANRACRTIETILCMDRSMGYLITNGEKARLVQKIVPYSTVPDYKPYIPEEDTAGDILSFAI